MPETRRTKHLPMTVKRIKQGIYRIDSQTLKGASYLVQLEDSIPSLKEPLCTCPDFIIRGSRPCKHIKPVKEFADAERLGMVVNPDEVKE